MILSNYIFLSVLKKIKVLIKKAFHMDFGNYHNLSIVYKIFILRSILFLPVISFIRYQFLIFSRFKY